MVVIDNYRNNLISESYQKEADIIDRLEELASRENTSIGEISDNDDFKKWIEIAKTDFEKAFSHYRKHF